jgi:hypothetical protein
MTESDSEGGISRRELLGGAGAATVAVLVGAGGYYVADANEITYPGPSDDEDDDGNGEDDQMSLAAQG